MCLGNIIPFRSMIQRMSENPDSHHECMPFTEVFKLLLKTSQERRVCINFRETTCKLCFMDAKTCLYCY